MHTDDNLNFSFQYPREAVITRTSQGVNLTLEMNNRTASLTITQKRAGSGQEFRDYAQKQLKDATDRRGEVLKPITISTISGKAVVSYAYERNGITNVLIFPQTGGSFIEVVYELPNKNLTDLNRVMENIISTIRVENGVAMPSSGNP